MSTLDTGERQRIADLRCNQHGLFCRGIASCCIDVHDDSVHTVDAHEAIAAELVACTLGQRVRPELTSHIYDPLRMM